MAKAAAQSHANSGPDDILVPSTTDMSRKAALWVEERIRKAARNNRVRTQQSKLPDQAKRWVLGMVRDAGLSVPEQDHDAEDPEGSGEGLPEEDLELG